MRYRQLGGSGVRVSTVALGSWLTFGHGVDEDGTARCVEAAFEAGINFIDTADVYALGRCETALGRVLPRYDRKDYVLATKVFFPMASGPNDCGLSRKHVTESIARSLDRLGVDYVDLYQCHRPDPDTPVREVVRTMDDLIRRGLICYWGVSMWPAHLIVEAVEIAERLGAEPPVSNQPCYNMLDREIERAVLPVSKERAVGQVVFSPLAQGVLTGKYSGGSIPAGTRAADDRSNDFMQRYMDPATLARVDRVAEIAKELGVKPSQLALAWCLRDEGVDSVIIGATRPEQVAENAAAAEIDLEPEILERIEDVLGS